MSEGIFHLGDVKLTVLGGGKEVGRSCYLYSTTRTNILIDCGLKIGDEDVITKETEFIPEIDDEIIEKGDVLIARGAPMGIQEFKRLAEGKIRKLEG